jgi:hypothetical protein
MPRVITVRARRPKVVRLSGFGAAAMPISLATNVPTYDVGTVAPAQITQPGSDPNLQFLPSGPLDSLYNFFTGKLTQDQIDYVTSQSATVQSPALNTPANVAQLDQDTQNYINSPLTLPISGSIPSMYDAITGINPACVDTDNNNVPCSAWQIINGNPSNCAGCPLLTTGDKVLLAAVAAVVLIFAMR